MEPDGNLSENLNSYLDGFKVMWDHFMYQLPQVVVGLLILVIFSVLAAPASKQIASLAGLINSSRLIARVFQKTLKAIFILFGFYLFLRLAGITDFAFAIISSTGVIGIILGFAFRDIAENFISSLLLSVQQPFMLNDVIIVGGHKGVVQKVTSRATTLVDFDGNHIQIPNATVYKNIIQNLTANPRSRGHVSVGIGYDSNIKVAQTLAMNVICSHFAVLKVPEPQVLVGELDVSTINLDVYFWIDSKNHSLPKIASLLMRRIATEFLSSGISMPDDNREVIFPEGIDVRMAGDKVQDAAKPAIEKADDFGNKESSAASAEDDSNEDISSDDEVIREQAAQAPAPEEGDNIL